MDTQNAKEGWDQLKGAILRRWGELNEDDLAGVRDDLNALAHRLSQRYGLSIEDARAQANAFLDEFHRRAGPAYQRARSGIWSAVRTVDDTVHRFPWETLGAAFLLGAIVGFSMRHDRWS